MNCFISIFDLLDQVDRSGWNVLVDADAQKIEDAAFHHVPAKSGFSELYGSGDAGEKIVEIISRQLL